MKELLTEINSDVKDILRMDFELIKTQSDLVPNHEDAGLTFETGKNKKAKTIETCVLYADIRNSTVLSKSKANKEMARLYTAFTKSIMNVAEYHHGVIRNIIGDRVMVVFPEKNCFTNAVDTAISINTVATRIISKHFSDFNFKCGIGIDYGEMLVVKAGIPKQEPERSNYKNLIWIGNPANIASKLTDVANKETKKVVFEVTQNPMNPRRFSFGRLSLLDSLMNPSARVTTNPSEPLYLSTVEKIEITPEEFADRLCKYDNGGYFFGGGNVLDFQRKEKTIIAPAILFSQKVYEEFKKANSTRKCITENFWAVQRVTIKEYTGNIYGGGVYWDVDTSQF